MQQSRIQVHIIDDDASVCTAFSRLVRSGDMDARAYSSVEEFLASDFATGDGCVVADVQLPGKSGLELPRLLSESGRSIPVIFVSGQLPDMAKVDATLFGAVACFPKPVDGRALIKAITVAARVSKAM